jgi:hypothetical protein
METGEVIGLWRSSSTIFITIGRFFTTAATT